MCRDHLPNILTREQIQKAEEFKADKCIITREPDESNVFVVSNKEEFENKLNETLKNSEKLQKIS